MAGLGSAEFLVSRVRLPGSPEPLNLNQADGQAGMEVVSVSAGQRVLNLVQATSPVTDGAVLVQAQAGLQTSSLVVRCWGTPAEILASFAEIEAAFSQYSYTVTVMLDEETTLETWYCQPANISRGESGTWDPNKLAAGWQDLYLDIPRQPDAHAL